MSQYINLLRRNKNYRYLWLGNVVSLLGDWFNLLASAELITELTNSGVAVSSLFLARFLPLFLFSPLAGVVADRYNRRRILIFTDVLRAVIVCGFLLIRSPEQVWLLYTLTVLQFALSALFTPARSAVLPNIVARDNLVTANALDSFTWSSMLALGALLGGIVATLFGRETAFILDALTFLLSALMISHVMVPKRTTSPVADQGGWLDFIDGFRYLWQRPILLIIALIKGAGSLVWGGINVLEVNFADHVFPLTETGFAASLNIEDGGTATLGLIYLTIGLGTGLGPLFFRRWFGDRTMQLLFGVTLGFILMPAGILGLGIAPSLLLFLTGTFVRTFGTGVLWVFSAVLLQMIVPDKYRGRVFAFEFTVLTLMQSLSIFGAGWILDNLGRPVQEVAVVFSLLGFLVCLVWLVFYLSKRTRVERWQQASAENVTWPTTVAD